MVLTVRRLKAELNLSDGCPVAAASNRGAINMRYRGHEHAR